MLFPYQSFFKAAFLELTQCLCCEVNTLADPRATIFAFCLLIDCYNAVSVVKAMLTTVHR
ncbi:MAG: hypothetical protein LBJ67_01795 [Planctomycetaceae bacterium]|nr:hypothetical protein [Planctomycetaceae bacterium]